MRPIGPLIDLSDVAWVMSGVSTRLRYSLAPQRLHRIHQRRLHALETHRQQRDAHGQPTHKGENPPTDVDFVSKIRQVVSRLVSMVFYFCYI